MVILVCPLTTHVAFLLAENPQLPSGPAFPCTPCVCWGPALSPLQRCQVTRLGPHQPSPPLSRCDWLA